jgi:hypothetical protein
VLVDLAAVAAGKPDVAAAYRGLKKQRVGIMVWADHGITIDHPSVQPDMAKGLEEKLKQAADAKIDDVRDMKWTEADDILRFQDAHPEMETDSALDLAKRLNVTRLIFVEVTALSLHPDESVDLSRGMVSVDLQVIEVTDGQTKTGYHEQRIAATWPPHSPPEGLPGLGDSDVYHHSVDAMTTEISKRFLKHEADSE